MRSSVKKFAAGFLAAAAVMQCAVLSGCSKKAPERELTVLSGDGRTVAALTRSTFAQTLADNEYRAYLDIVLSEAAGIIGDIRDCDTKEAERLLLSEGYVIYTNLDCDIYASLKKAYEQEEGGLSFGAAVTDLRGDLLAVYSGGARTEEYHNRAAAKAQPYSAFKPLSVYAPAIENGLASWSSVYEDSPYKKISGDDGSEQDWPANATGTYTYRETTVYDAVKQSLNTVAVKCMQTVGVFNSMNFLKNKFGISLESEKSSAAMYGEEEVIGNVALGYLYDGLSPVDMAGYYQVFANGGIYNEPRAVSGICDKDGGTVYERVRTDSRVISETTAYIMNRLLQGVISPDGTGSGAACGDIPVGGKTGTGDGGNWFVGFTPQYSCAVWHGTEIGKNRAAEIFSRAVSEFESDTEKSFPDCIGVKAAAYCTESGMLLSDGCRKIDMGYYASDRMPAVCDKH